MDHLGIDKFMVMGFCIGGPFIWNLLRRAPDRVIAAVLAQPSGSRPECPPMYDGNMTSWGPALVKRRPEITMDMVDKFLTKMYRTNPDFVFTVTRDFVRNCQTPVLILPDDIPAHPYAVAMEAAMLAPKVRSEHVPVEGAEGAHSARGAPDPFVPARPPLRLRLAPRSSYDRGATAGGGNDALERSVEEVGKQSHGTLSVAQALLPALFLRRKHKAQGPIWLLEKLHHVHPSQFPDTPSSSQNRSQPWLEM